VNVNIDERDLAELLERARRAEAANTELQARGTELALENRKLSARVSELEELLGWQRSEIELHVEDFNWRFGYRINGGAPEVPHDDEVRFRSRLMVEEFCEVMEVLFGCTPATMDEIRLMLRSMTSLVTIHVDLPKLARELADLDFVVQGTRASFGLPRAPVARVVHRANMAKLPSGGDKPTKPEGWAPPDVEAVLRACGWRG
jgi:predicted HAD superfamily Cof-like phosphohydrolase